MAEGVRDRTQGSGSVFLEGEGCRMQGFQMQNNNTKKKPIDQRVKKRNCRLSRRPLLARSGITGGNVEMETNQEKPEITGGELGAVKGV